MDNGSQTSPSSKQVCKRTQYEDPFAFHSLLSSGRLSKASSYCTNIFLEVAVHYVSVSSS